MVVPEIGDVGRRGLLNASDRSAVVRKVVADLASGIFDRIR
jgi:hypothetical protein